jgi:hypothetical protein
MRTEHDAPPAAPAFALVRRGYDRAQVDDRFRELTTMLDGLGAERERTAAEAVQLRRQLEQARSEAQTAQRSLEDAQHEVERLGAKVAELSTAPPSVDGMSERLQQMVRVAQDEVNDMRRRATAAAVQTRALAEAEAAETRERTEAEREAFEAEHRTAVAALQTELDETRAELDRRRQESDAQLATLDAELADRRARAERDLEKEIEDRRTAARAELAQHEERRRVEAGQVLDAAAAEARAQLSEVAATVQRMQAEAQSAVAEAQRELDDLRGLQHQVSEQLTSVRALLDWTLPQFPGTGSGSRHGRPEMSAVAAPAPLAVASGDAGEAQPTAAAEPAAGAGPGTAAEALVAVPDPAAGPTVESPGGELAASSVERDRPSPVARTGGGSRAGARRG